jgi:ketosteroid isomerase-like protein
MRIRDCVLALLLASFASTIHGQAPTSLLDADQALADALTRHDRAAFVALLSPDAECSLPVVKHGPEAIAATWLLFFIDPGTTMVLTRTDVHSTSPDSGTTAGTFAIRGRTNNGIQTIPAGTYSIVWKLVDGQWRISMLGGSGTPKRLTGQPK